MTLLARQNLCQRRTKSASQFPLPPAQSVASSGWHLSHCSHCSQRSHCKRPQQSSRLATGTRLISRPSGMIIQFDTSGAPQQVSRVDLLNRIPGRSTWAERWAQVELDARWPSARARPTASTASKTAAPFQVSFCPPVGLPVPPTCSLMPRARRARTNCAQTCDSSPPAGTPAAPPTSKIRGRVRPRSRICAKRVQIVASPQLRRATEAGECVRRWAKLASAMRQRSRRASLRLGARNGRHLGRRPFEGAREGAEESPPQTVRRAPSWHRLGTELSQTRSRVGAELAPKWASIREQ